MAATKVEIEADWLKANATRRSSAGARARTEILPREIVDHLERLLWSRASGNDNIRRSTGKVRHRFHYRRLGNQCDRHDVHRELPGDGIACENYTTPAESSHEQVACFGLPDPLQRTWRITRPDLVFVSTLLKRFGPKIGPARRGLSESKFRNQE